MATVIKTNARNLPDPPFGGVPYGNATKLQYTFETNTSGVMATAIRPPLSLMAIRLFLVCFPQA